LTQTQRTVCPTEIVTVLGLKLVPTSSTTTTSSAPSATRSKFTVTVRPALTVADRLALDPSGRLYPSGRSIETVYSPGSRLSKLYEPDEDVVVVRSTGPLRATWTPDTPPPVVRRTVPEIVPVSADGGVGSSSLHATQPKGSDNASGSTMRRPRRCAPPVRRPADDTCAPAMFERKGADMTRPPG